MFRKTIRKSQKFHVFNDPLSKIAEYLLNVSRSSNTVIIVNIRTEFLREQFPGVGPDGTPVVQCNRLSKPK